MSFSTFTLVQPWHTLMRSTSSVSSGAVPATDPELVRKALTSFASTSGAGPSGLRPSHLQEALRCSSGDQTLSLVSEVVQMMLRGSRTTFGHGFVERRSWPFVSPTTPWGQWRLAKRSGGFAAWWPSNSCAPLSAPS